MTKAKSKQIRQRQELVEKYQAFTQNLVKRMIRVFALPMDAYDELLSCAYMGLVEAAERYDPDSKVAFKNYSYLRIRGAVIDGLRRLGNLSPRAYQLCQAWSAANDLRELQQAEAEGCPGQSSQQLLEEMLEYITKGAFIFQLSMSDLEQELSVNANLSHEQDRFIDAKRSAAELKDLVAQLPDKERRVVEAFYFQQRSFVEIADEYGDMTKSWVSRLHARAINRLREWYFVGC